MDHYNSTGSHKSKSGNQKPPSRSRPTSESTGNSSQESLIRMGFSKDRAEKAVAWTGDVSVPAAVDWILSHKDDPVIDKKEEREYLVYLCPSGPLLDIILEYLNKTSTHCGRNGAHLHLPHITMCHAFKTVDSNISFILKSMRDAYQRVVDRLPEKIVLDRYTSETFMGLFLDDQSEKILKEYSQHLVKELQTLTDYQISNNTKKAFHLTLAYHFNPSHYETLLSLNKRIDLKAPAKWHFRLYSRDPRFNSHEVYQMSRQWNVSNTVEEELPFVPGDYVYVSPQETDKSRDGWLSGCSWMSGTSGLVPLNGLQKCFDSDVWLLHGVISYSAGTAGIETGNHIDENLFPSAQRFRWVSKIDGRAPGGSLSQQLLLTGSPLLAPVKRHHVNSNDSPASTVYVMRHGERMDFVFGLDWINKCFDSEGNFTRMDLNMPKSVPKRRAGSSAYIRDPPLTAIGLLQAQITGKAMKDSGVSFNRVFVSPALRSIQTATAVIEGTGHPACTDQKNLRLCVEPGLYEWFGWVKEAHPDWLSPADLHSFGIPVDLDYRPLYQSSKLNFEESVEDFYMRNGNVVKKMLEQFAHEGGNMLFVAHASSLDTCTRQLVGEAPRSHFDMNKVTQRVPYCAVVTCCKGADKNWFLKNPPFPALTHGANIKFNAVKTFSADIERFHL